MRDPDQLFRRYQTSRRPRDLALVYDEVSSELFDLALHLVGHPADAEDVLQAALLAVIEGIEGYNPRRRVMPWMVGILKNQVRAFLRDRGSMRRVEGVELEGFEDVDTSSAMEQSGEREELLRELDNAMSKLPEDWRPVLILRLGHGLKASEIAHALRRPPGTVRSQLARGLAELRRLLPAGLTGAALVWMGRPLRGLEAVRAEVVRHAISVQPTFLGVSAIAGIVLMKQVAVAIVIAAVSISLVYIISGENSVASANSSGTEDVAKLEEIRSLRTPMSQSERSPVTQVVEQRRADPQVDDTVVLAEEAGGEVLVRVHYKLDGEPAENALVLLSIGQQRHFPTLRSGITDSSGEVLFESVPEGNALVRILRGSRANILIRSGGKHTVELQMFNGVTVLGEVVDEANYPVANAEIWVSERFSISRGLSLARTDRNGRFELEGLGKNYSIAARAPGYATTDMFTVDALTGNHFRMKLVLSEAGYELDILVEDELQNAIEGAEVLLGPETPPLRKRRATGFFAYGPPPQEGVTDSSGRVRFSSVPAGRHFLAVRAKGFGPQSIEVEVTPNLSSDVRLELRSGAMVEGLVTDSFGAPISGASVTSNLSGKFQESWAMTGLDGRFSLDTLPDGPVELQVTSDNFARVRKTLELQPGAQFEWNPILEAATRIFGRVLDESGEPLKDYHVVAREPGGRSRSKSTNAAGEFAIVELEPREYTLWVLQPAGWDVFPLLILDGVRPSEDSIDLRLEPKANSSFVHGVVLDSRGQPAEGASITLWHDTARIWRTYPVNADDGKFEIHNVMPGSIELQVRSELYPWRKLGNHEVRAGERLDLGRIMLDPSGSAEGWLVGGSDDRLDSVTLLLLGEEGQEQGVVTRTERKLNTNPIVPGRYTVVLGGDFICRVSAVFEIREGEVADFDLELIPAGKRQVRLLLPEGSSPPRWVWCAAYDSQGEVAWLGNAARPKGDSAIVLNVSALPGVYRFIARTNEGCEAESQLSIDDYRGLQPPLELQLRR